MRNLKQGDRESDPKIMLMYRERERERERDTDTDTHTPHTIHTL
jgi:hypothetical protein